MVDTIECMIGTSCKTRILVENPLGESVVFDMKLSGGNGAFLIEQESVVVAPYGQNYFIVNFTPDKLYNSTPCYVSLEHVKFGEIQYELIGSGQLPGNMPLTEISSSVNILGSYVISFYNPFIHALPINIILTNSNIYNNNNNINDNDDDEVFQLLLRKSSGLVVSSQSTIQIPISFTPTSLHEYSSILQIRCDVEGRNLLWCYPIIGIADAGPPIHLPHISIPCKTSITREFEMKLQGLRCTDVMSIHDFSLQSFCLEVMPESLQHKAIITRALHIQPVLLRRIHSDISTDFIIHVKILFEPLKVFNSLVNLTISCPSLGRWHADIDIESTQPSSDDVIRLSASVGSSDTVSFRLNNRFLSYSPFKCYFAPRSSTKFQVTPNSGVLPPYGSEGATFVVTFSPTEYGNFQKAHLIISTEDAQWDYEVIGEFPQNNPSKSDIRSKTISF